VEQRRLVSVCRTQQAPDTFITAKTVKPGSKVDGLKTAGDSIISINGIFSRGMNMVDLVTKSTTLSLIVALK
jgi:hypothetical protein